jgi:hypothetical protein
MLHVTGDEAARQLGIAQVLEELCARPVIEEQTREPLAGAERLRETAFGDDRSPA